MVSHEAMSKSKSREYLEKMNRLVEGALFLYLIDCESLLQSSYCLRHSFPPAICKDA